MDLSGLIFVALAVAWAVYLVPKALRHHEDVSRARTVDRFSDSMRVLARREPVSARAARLVVSASRTHPRPGGTTTVGAAVVETSTPTPEELSRRRSATRRATKRRQRVLAGLLVLLAGVAAVAGLDRIAWVWLAAPVVLLVGWLVLCRLMVKGERAATRRAAHPDDAIDTFEAEDGEPEVEVHTDDQGFDQVETDPALDTGEMPAVSGATAVGVSPSRAAPGTTGRTGLWDPLPMTLPTYVSKPKATRRTVRTIDLDDSDVWTSGHTEADSALAREADAERAVPVAPDKPDDSSRAVGS